MKNEIMEIATRILCAQLSGKNIDDMGAIEKRRLAQTSVDMAIRVLNEIENEIAGEE
jgi:hypothetical protein